MADLCDIVKNGVVVASVACGAAFAQAAAPAAPSAPGATTRLERAAQNGPAGKMAADSYAKPMNDASLEAVKQQLLQLPRSEIREASSTFHKMNLAERDQMRDIGRMMVSDTPPDQVRQKIAEIKSPELRDGLIDLQKQIEQDKKGSDKAAPHKDMQEGIQKLDDAAKTRETAFKTVVDEAAKGRLNFEINQRRAERGINTPS